MKAVNSSPFSKFCESLARSSDCLIKRCCFFLGLGVQNVGNQLVVGIDHEIVHFRHIAHSKHSAATGLLHFFHTTHELRLRDN